MTGYWQRLGAALFRTATDLDADVNEAASVSLPDTLPNQTVSLHVAMLARDEHGPCRFCHLFGVAMCVFLSLGVQDQHCELQFTTEPTPWWVALTAGWWFLYILAGIPAAFAFGGFWAGLAMIAIIWPIAALRWLVARSGSYIIRSTP